MIQYKYIIYDILNIQPRFHHSHHKNFFRIPKGSQGILPIQKNAQPSSAFGVFVSRQNGRKVGVDVVRPRLALPPETTRGRCLESSASHEKRSHGLKMTGNLHHGLEKFICYNIYIYIFIYLFIIYIHYIYIYILYIYIL